LEIPRLGLSTVIFEGTGEDVLLRGAGHLRGSALPGEKGNVVVAGHRDTFFRPLRNLREGDAIDLDLGSGLRHYVVAETEIVNPEDTEVLQATPRPMLTLVTCYPFYFVGNAPQRFIARCREVKEAPAAEAGKTASGLIQTGLVQQAPLRPRRLGSRRLALARAKAAVAPEVEVEPKFEVAPHEPVPTADLRAAVRPPNESAAVAAPDSPASSTDAPKPGWAARMLNKLKRVVRRSPED
jgi:LPXTG-site transpeptidase (sortase) family protein